MKKLIAIGVAAISMAAVTQQASAFDICQMMSDNASQVMQAAISETKDGKIDIALDPERDGMYTTMVKTYVNTFIKSNAGKVDDTSIELAESYVYHKCKDIGL